MYKQNIKYTELICNYWKKWKHNNLKLLLKDKKITLFFVKRKIKKKKKNRQLKLRLNWVAKRFQLNTDRKIYSNKNKTVKYKHLLYNIILV